MTLLGTASMLSKADVAKFKIKGVEVAAIDLFGACNLIGIGGCRPR